MKNQVAAIVNRQVSEIKEIREWAFVYWVSFTSGRPTLVSKKAIKKDCFFNSFEPDNSHAERAEAMAARIANCLPPSNNAQYGRIFDAAVDVLEDRCSFEEAVERLSSKKVILRAR